LVLEEHGWEDYTSWVENDRKTLVRINKLVEDVLRDPFEGIGKPEPLKYHLPGAWSRRIVRTTW
jgi:toxin YoeB